MKHILGILVHNHAGVLSKVAGLFARRGYNIDSLAVGTTGDPEVSRITITTTGDDDTLEQIIKQLNKLIDVIKVTDISGDSVMRELVLIKVAAPAACRGEIIQVANIFRANIVDVSQGMLTIEVTGPEDKVNALTKMLVPYGILELVRTGTIAIQRGMSNLEENTNG
jgi:acetolactate synthase-1/3 small subunit